MTVREDLEHISHEIDGILCLLSSRYTLDASNLKIVTDRLITIHRNVISCQAKVTQEVEDHKQRIWDLKEGKWEEKQEQDPSAHNNDQESHPKEHKQKMQSMVARSRWMNKTFNLPCNSRPTDSGNLRLYEFESVLHEELSEIKKARQAKRPIDRFVALADLLGDILVYTLSEAQRWGIDIEAVYNAIMDSQESKLDDNGKPLMAPDGSKFIKGPNYTPPEPEIERIIIKSYMAGTEPEVNTICHDK